MVYNLLSQWYKAVVIRDFGITEDMVLGGSGVKKAIREHCGTHDGLQEWCMLWCSLSALGICTQI
jgi:hypothetical protein